MKCFIGNLDGKRNGLILAKSKEEAMRHIPTGRVDFNNYWGATECPSGTFEPLTLYTRPANPIGAQPWVKGRCPL